MKRVIALAITAVLCAGMLSACTKTSYDAETNTVYIEKKGKIVSKDVELFDEGEYQADDLKEYVENAVKEYTEANGKDTVKFDSLSVKDNMAALILKYASASDYTAFTGTDLFAGTVAEALSAGYTFEDDFVDRDGNLCSTATVLDDSSLKVAIVKGNLNLKVKGEIVYHTIKNVILVDKNTVSIDPAYELGDVEGTETLEIREQAEQATEGIMEDQDGSEESGGDTGSVGDDELLAVGESTETMFKFDETIRLQDLTGSVSDVYTYVVYK